VQKANAFDLKKVQRIYAKDRTEKTGAEVHQVLELFRKYRNIEYAESEVDRLAREALERFEEVSMEIAESPLKETAKDAILNLASRRV
jgi:geranylgeranyl pyrophosphate synthase